jgi:hypothetical protein
MTIAIAKVGRRYYLRGNTRPIKGQLKEAGCHWDPEEGAWWTSKRDVAERFQREASALPEPPAPCEPSADDVAITGNTYSIRDQLRALGGRWDAARKVWMVPADRADEARALVPPTKPRKQTRAGGSKAKKPTSFGSKEGSAHTFRRRVNERKSFCPVDASDVGEVFRAGSKVGPLAGKAVIVLGIEAQWTSSDWEDDCGQTGVGSGWWVYRHVREATAEEAAPLLAREAEQKAKADAERAAKEDKAAAYAAAKECETAGLVRSTWLRATAGERIAQDDTGYHTLSLSRGDLGGTPVVVESSYAYDDHRSWVYAPAEVVAREHARIAAERGIDRDAAMEWLSKYAGCHGEELYRQVAGFSMDAPVDQVRAVAGDAAATSIGEK